MQKRLTAVGVVIAAAFALVSCYLYPQELENRLSSSMVKQHTEIFTYSKHLQNLRYREEELPSNKQSLRIASCLKIVDYLVLDSNLWQQPIAFCSLSMSTQTKNGDSEFLPLWLRQVVTYLHENINYGHPLKLPRYEDAYKVEKTIKKIALSAIGSIENQLYTRNTAKKELDHSFEHALDRNDLQNKMAYSTTPDNSDEVVLVGADKEKPDVESITPIKGRLSKNPEAKPISQSADRKLTPRSMTNHQDHALATESFSEKFDQSGDKFKSQKRLNYGDKVYDQFYPVVRKINFFDESVNEVFPDSPTSNSASLKSARKEDLSSVSYGLRDLMVSLQNSQSSDDNVNIEFNGFSRSTGKTRNQNYSDQEAEISVCSGKQYYSANESFDQKAEISAHLGLCSSENSQEYQGYAQINIWSGKNSEEEAEISACSGKNHSQTITSQEDDTFFDRKLSKASVSFDSSSSQFLKEQIWAVSPVAHKQNYDSDWFFSPR